MKKQVSLLHMKKRVNLLHKNGKNRQRKRKRQAEPIKHLKPSTSTTAGTAVRRYIFSL
jgi:hypothetical protein